MAPYKPIYQARIFAGALVAALAAAQVVVPAPAGATDLDEANRKWRGARCRTRLEITAKKKSSGDWSKCKWLFWDENRGNSRVRVLVSDGAAVHRAFRGGTLPIGTEFTALGWAVEEGSKNLYLELELVGHPVRARVFFYDDWVGRVSVNRLEDFERWAQFDFLHLISMPSEQLVDVPAVSATSQPAPVPRPAPPPAAPAETGPPAIQVLTVAVQPALVAPGRETALIMTYEVGGVPPGPGFEVLELREIYQGEQRLAGFEERLRRANGTFTSSQPLRVPPDLAPGVYSLRATVVMAGREANGTALFEVTTTP